PSAAPAVSRGRAAPDRGSPLGGRQRSSGQGRSALPGRRHRVQDRAAGRTPRPLGRKFDRQFGPGPLGSYGVARDGAGGVPGSSSGCFALCSSPGGCRAVAGGASSAFARLGGVPCARGRGALSRRTGCRGGPGQGDRGGPGRGCRVLEGASAHAAGGRRRGGSVRSGSGHGGRSGTVACEGSRPARAPGNGGPGPGRWYGHRGGDPGGPVDRGSARGPRAGVVRAVYAGGRRGPSRRAAAVGAGDHYSAAGPGGPGGTVSGGAGTG